MTRSRLLMLIAFVTTALGLGFGCSSSETRTAPAQEVADNPCGGACGIGQQCCTNNCDGTKYCVTKSIKCPNLTCPPDLQQEEALQEETAQEEAAQEETIASTQGDSLVECNGEACDAGERCCVIDCGGTRACRSPCIPPLCPVE